MTPQELKIYAQNRAIANSGLSISGSTKVVVVAAVLGWPLGFFLAGWAGAGALAVAAIWKAAGSVTEMNDEWDAIASGDVQTVREWLTPADLEEIKAAAAPPKLPGTSMTETPQVAPAAPQEPPTPPKATPTSGQAQTACGNPSSAAGAPSGGWDEDTPQAAPEKDTALDVLTSALAYPTVLIYGTPGSGKSTVARWLVKERLQASHVIEILDPHAAYGAWGSLPVFGGGKDYEACNQRLVEFSALVKSRYQQLYVQPDFNPRPKTLLVEEFTLWKDHCPAAAEFFSSSLADIRKVNLLVVYVSHSNTLSSLGGSSGTAYMRDASLLELEMLGKIGGDGKAVPTGLANIYWPNKKKQPQQVQVPKIGAIDFGQPPAPTKETTLEEKVLVHLKKAGGSKTPGRIRADVRGLEGWTLEQVDRLLAEMVSKGSITEREGKYQAA